MDTPDTSTDMTAATGTHPVPRAITVAGREVDIAIVLRVLGGVWLTLVGWQLSGGVGVAIGLGIAAVAVVARPISSVAVAHAGLLVLVPEVTAVDSLIQLGLFELGVLAILLSERPVDGPTALLAVAFGLTFVGTTVAVQLWASQLAATGGLCGLVAILAYGIHRYERVSLGLVVDTDETEHYE
jgi:hypothetical protein